MSEVRFQRWHPWEGLVVHVKSYSVRGAGTIGFTVKELLAQDRDAKRMPGSYLIRIEVLDRNGVVRWSTSQG